jgi:hypothetical protein
MSDRREYLGEKLTHARLHRRREEIQERHGQAISQVNTLLSTQKSIGDELGNGLTTLKEQGQELDRLRVAESDNSLLSTLVRPFTSRRTALARRSVAEGLLAHYEKTSTRLREATAFSDELKLCALEMQQEVDRLHRELGQGLHNQRLAAERMLECERGLEELDALTLTDEQRARRQDRYTFDLRTEAVALQLFKSSADQCRQHLEPARALRDTVLQLHEDMAQYVLSATHTVNAAGRRIQGLGMMADAPIVVQELQESLNELNQAMEATQHYIENSRKLIEEVLPDLSAKIDAENESDVASLVGSLEAVDRARSRQLAEQALRDAAESEIDDLLREGD